jgi:bacterioferritin-associated ferredoxin
MIVCQCKAVRDCEVRTLVQRGACTRAAVTRACGAGSDCGGCRPVIEEIIADEQRGAPVARSHGSARDVTQLSL